VVTASSVWRVISNVIGLIMVYVVFETWFNWWRSYSQHQYLASSDVYGLVFALLLPLLFSAIVGPFWGFVFGVSLAFGVIYGYTSFSNPPPLWRSGPGGIVGATIGYTFFLSLLTVPGYGFGGIFSSSISSMVWEWMNSSRLKALERTRAHRINELKTIKGGHDSLLSQKKDLEQKVSEVTSLDPSNLELKKASFQSQASTIASNQIPERLSEIRRKTEEIIESRKTHERNLANLRKERDRVEADLSRCEFELSELESNDPANVGIKLRKLHEKWDNLTQQQLEKMRSPDGQGGSALENLFKKKLLLRFRILNRGKEIETEEKELAHLDRAATMSKLEDLVLQLEEKNRQIKSVEPEMLAAREELSSLEKEAIDRYSPSGSVSGDESSERKVEVDNHSETTAPSVRNELEHGNWLCPKCKRINSAKAKFCTGCGEPKN
jgi:hypothetical protein